MLAHRPFGLMLLVEPRLEDAVDLTGVRYCEDRQVLMTADGCTVFLATKYTTPSRTEADNQRWTDFEQDSD